MTKDQTFLALFLAVVFLIIIVLFGRLGIIIVLGIISYLILRR